MSAWGKAWSKVWGNAWGAPPVRLPTIYHGAVRAMKPLPVAEPKTKRKRLLELFILAG